MGTHPGRGQIAVVGVVTHGVSVGCLLVIAAACGGAPPAGGVVAGSGPRGTTAVAAAGSAGSRRAAGPGGAPSYIRPGRTYALPTAADRRGALKARDGATRMIIDGLRVEERPDGSLLRGREVLPGRSRLGTLELPARLGGGFLFHETQSRRTRLWRAKRWTAPLEPLAEVNVKVKRIVAGFDRLYLERDGKLGTPFAAIDAQKGTPVPVGSLPAAPQLGDIAIVDDWVGVVQVPFLGAMMTVDAGSSWRVLGPAVAKVEASHGSARLSIDGEHFRVGPSARLVPETEGERSTSFRGAALPRTRAALNAQRRARASAPAPYTAGGGRLGEVPLAQAALRGIPDAADTALVLVRGALARVSLKDGRLLAERRRAVAEGLVCQGVRIGAAPGFVCSRQRGATIIYRVAGDLELERRLWFPDPRAVAAGPTGALAVGGGCRPERARPGAYCILGAAGSQHEILVRGDQGAERVVAFADGRAAVLVPPRLGAPPTLTFVDRQGKATSLRLNLPKDAKSLADSFWMQGFWERPEGGIAGWVTDSLRLTGVRIDLDGTIRVGDTVDDAQRVLVSGPLALQAKRGGAVQETVDGGFDWRDVDLPVTFEGAFQSTPKDALDERGCGPVGCALGSWLRVGWSGPPERVSKGADGPEKKRSGAAGPDLGELDDAPEPPSRRFLVSSSRSWGVRCHATGLERKLKATATARRTGAVVRRRPRRWRSRSPFGRPRRPPRPQAGPLPGFLGVAAPTVAKGQDAYHYGKRSNLLQFHAYVFGTPGPTWTRDGRFVLRGSDPFAAVDGAVWSTQEGRSPWDSEIEAGEAFGRGSGYTYWTPSLEPSGRAMAFHVKGSRGELVVAEADGRVGLLSLRGTGLTRLDGLVRVQGVTYVGSNQPKGFRIFRLAGSTVKLVAELPKVAGVPKHAELVRSDDGQHLGVWVRGRAYDGDWFVYAVDRVTGRAEVPTVVAARTLARDATACPADAGGWVLMGRPHTGLRVHADNVESRFYTRDHLGRFLLTPDGVCVDALAARLGGSAFRVRRQGGPTGGFTIPLTLHDRNMRGPRHELRCRME